VVNLPRPEVVSLIGVRRLAKYPDKKDYWSESGENQFWKEYHFFIHSIFDIIQSLRNNQDRIPWALEIFSTYDKNIAVITEKVKGDRALWPEHGLANKMYRTIINYYLSIKENSKATQLEEKYKCLGWR